MFPSYVTWSTGHWVLLIMPLGHCYGSPSLWPSLIKALRWLRALAPGMGLLNYLTGALAFSLCFLHSPHNLCLNTSETPDPYGMNSNSWGWANRTFLVYLLPTHRLPSTRLLLSSDLCHFNVYTFLLSQSVQFSTLLFGKSFLLSLWCLSWSIPRVSRLPPSFLNSKRKLLEGRTQSWLDHLCVMGAKHSGWHFQHFSRPFVTQMNELNDQEVCNSQHWKEK